MSDLWQLRGAFGKFLAWPFISETDLQTLSCLVSFYLSFMLWHKIHEVIIMQARKILV